MRTSAFKFTPQRVVSSKFTCSTCASISTCRGAWSICAMYAAIRASDSGRSSTTTRSCVSRLFVGLLAPTDTLPIGDKKFVTVSATTVAEAKSKSNT